MTTHCQHGNRRDLGICPECDHEKQRKRQRKADRARFAAQVARVSTKVES